MQLLYLLYADKYQGLRLGLGLAWPWLVWVLILHLNRPLPNTIGCGTSLVLSIF